MIVIVIVILSARVVGSNSDCNSNDRSNGKRTGNSNLEMFGLEIFESSKHKQEVIMKELKAAAVSTEILSTNVVPFLILVLAGVGQAWPGVAWQRMKT